MDEKETAVENDNVVGRLYNIINSLKSSQGSAIEAFSKTFDIQDQDVTKVMVNYAELFKMCTTGIKEIQDLNPKHLDKYTKTLNDTINGISKISFNDNSGFNRGMDNFQQFFDSIKMLSLENCADFLSEHSNQTLIADSKILELTNELNELIDSVLKSKLDKELEKVLIVQLNNVRESLLKYKLYGNEGIINSISQSLGAIFLNSNKADENDKTVIQKVIETIGKIFSATTMNAEKLLNLYSSFKQLTEHK